MAQPSSDDPRTNSGGGDGANEPAAEGQRVDERFEHWGRSLGKFIAGAAARAREGAEDIVAEAQSIRRGERD